jgi:endonuclease YncB( thermonuclease family)
MCSARLAVFLAILVSASFLKAEAASAAPCGMRAFEANVTRVIDGDTIVADVRLGFGMWAMGKRVRLAGIDAPELSGADARRGAAARKALVRRVGGKPVVLCPLPDRYGRERTDGFGRVLAIVWRREPSGYARNVNVWMVLADHAEPSWKPRLLLDLLPGS